MYWLALFGPFTKRPFAEKRKVPLSTLASRDAETTLRKCPTKNSWKLKKKDFRRASLKVSDHSSVENGSYVFYISLVLQRQSRVFCAHSVLHKSFGFHIHPKVSSLEKCWHLQWSSWFFPSTSMVFSKQKTLALCRQVSDRFSIVSLATGSTYVMFVKPTPSVVFEGTQIRLTKSTNDGGGGNFLALHGFSILWSIISGMSWKKNMGSVMGMVS